MEGIIAIGLITLLASMSPGPDFIVVTKNALKYNSRIGIFTAFGVGTAIMVHVFYTLIGVGILVSKSIVLYSVIKYLGALYLIYIGFKSLFSKSEDIEEVGINKSESDITYKSAFAQGFYTNLLNPKATLFFVSVFTQIVTPSTSILLKWVYGFEMATIAIVWFTVISVVFGNISFRIKIRKVQKYLDKVMGTVLIALGLKIALSKE